MPGFDYLDKLDSMRSGGAAPRQRSIISRLQAPPRLKQATAYQAPAAGSVASSQVSASRQPSTMQRDAGVSRSSTRVSQPIAPAPVMRPAAAPAAGGGNYNYSSVSASPTGQYGGAPAEGIPEIGNDFEPTDSIYLSEAGGINADVDSLLNSLKRERASYDVDFGAALRNLGWELGEKGLEDPNSGKWQQQNMMGAYGSAYNNQQNDFAGRGMLGSSFYGKALEDLLSSFDRQRGDMIGARQRQQDDWTEQGTEAENQRRQGLDRAKASALARRAAGLSLGGV